MTISPTTATILDAVARACAAAIPDAEHVFAAGVDETQMAAAAEIVPLADDFSEVGLPTVTIALGQWEEAIHTSRIRTVVMVECAVWRERFPLDKNTAALYADRDAIDEQFVDHAKLYFADPGIESAVLQGGPGIVPRSIPRGMSDQRTGPRLLLTLPFRVKVTCGRIQPAQPA